MGAPTIDFDIGTAYDFFISLDVLHDPGRYGVRPAWAAGMRSRLPFADRETLELANQVHLLVPSVTWIYELPAPKDSRAALRALDALPADQRIRATSWIDKEQDEPIADLLRGVIDRGSWVPDELAQLSELWRAHKGKRPPSRKQLSILLDTWAQPAEFGERYLTAMRAYYEVFFAEEEARIRPFLEDGLAHARELAARLEFSALMEELSQGVRFEEPPHVEEVVLAPSFWGSPYIFYMEGPRYHLYVFGARPAEASLVPGEAVPDALINGLKALSDPTRLRILRYLTSESLTPTQLARRLRLRAPTVIHHLSMLRVAGLVTVTVSKKEKIYAARRDGVDMVCKLLQGFVSSEQIDELQVDYSAD